MGVFKVGDTVQVKKNLTNTEKIWSSWNSTENGMDQTKGALGVIIKASPKYATNPGDRRFVNIIGQRGWTYHESALKKVPKWRVKKLRRNGKGVESR